MGESIPKQHKSTGMFKILKTKGRKKGEKKSSKKDSKYKIPEHVKRYDVGAELAKAPPELTFGPLVRGETELSKKETNWLLTR